MQHRIRHVEGVGKCGALIRQTEQVLVRDDDQGIDKGLHLLDPGFGLSHAALSLKVEGLGHHTDGQDATLAGSAGDHGCRTGASAAAHAGGDEHHVAIGKLAHHGFDALFGGSAPDVWLRAGTKSLRNRRAKLDLAAGKRMRKRLSIGVRNEEINPVKVGIDHVVDGIAAGAANTDNGDARTQFLHGLRNGQIDGHD